MSEREERSKREKSEKRRKIERANTRRVRDARVKEREREREREGKIEREEGEEVLASSIDSIRMIRTSCMYLHSHQDKKEKRHTCPSRGNFVRTHTDTNAAESEIDSQVS